MYLEKERMNALMMAWSENLLKFWFRQQIFKSDYMRNPGDPSRRILEKRNIKQGYFASI